MLLPTDILTILSDPETTADILQAIAIRGGDARFARAAGLLRARPGHRPMKDDSASIEAMGALIARGAATSPEQAARYLSRTLPGEVSSIAAASRLARKYRAAHK